jgi:DNA-binding response OmpR family regulator
MLQIYVRNLARRGGTVPFFSLPTLQHGELRLDPATREVSVGENLPQHLTQLEFRLLYTLMTHAGQTLPAETLVEYVWGYEGEGNRELVRGLIQRLRSKVDHNPQGPRYIINEPGIGYRFEIKE